jgi:hypothetical protein
MVAEIHISGYFKFEGIRRGDSHGFIWLPACPVTGFFKKGNDSTYSIKCGIFRD